MQEKDHEFFMREALKEARKAFEQDEVPVGAVIAYEGSIIARAHNLRERSQDATAHAEVLAIKAACEAMGTWRLTGCSLYVTLEPCPMCAGAIILARLDRVVFGAPDPKAGAAGSVVDLFKVERFNHHPEVVSGVLAEECGILLKDFFRQKRL
ncbi:tRNA adenosine(34) deaminase TadA [Thermosediminibacter oceani]|uniref:tRNA-specific adenosine deaminase n=1 Tax=Thermosediminibacter oceani (strain ATCC BAA-1034 / DSM 16646 / JW/IW-1228P) TaxID=555079 RepID=D9S0K8_THEOJ|nr:tRNA adenosine(34) deaminase TadA [Thermosediminibacter oceani]ADL08866.1 tRNA-adenosine deaminase [Thermosediminibacter oceani DSM 16646]